MRASPTPEYPAGTGNSSRVRGSASFFCAAPLYGPERQSERGEDARQETQTSPDKNRHGQVPGN